MKRWAILSNSWRRDRGGQVGSIYRLPVHPVHLLSTSLFIVYGTSPFIVYQSIYCLPTSPSGPFIVHQLIQYIYCQPAHPVHLLSTSPSRSFIVYMSIYCPPAHLLSTCPLIVYQPINCLPAHLLSICPLIVLLSTSPLMVYQSIYCLPLSLVVHELEVTA